jgi:hypothetical protein
MTMSLTIVARLAVVAAAAGVAVAGVTLLSPLSPPSATAQQPGSRYALIENGVHFSFAVSTIAYWERFTVATGTKPRGRISLNRSIVGAQGAEAIIYWTSFPHGDYADPCARLLAPSIGRSAAALAAAVATAPGTELVKGPSNVTLGGHPAKRVVLTVRKNIGCDPGFFYRWADHPLGGAFWHMHAGDTMRVWIVSVNGTRLFVAAATSVHSGRLDEEIRKIVGSIKFD